MFGDFLFAGDFADSKLAYSAALDWATRVGQLGASWVTNGTVTSHRQSTYVLEFSHHQKVTLVFRLSTSLKVIGTDTHIGLQIDRLPMTFY